MSLLVSTCRFRSVARHCWFPPAVSDLSHVTVVFHLPFPVCRRRRTSSDVVIEEEELGTCRSHSFFFLFSFFLICYCCYFLPQRCRLSNGNCLAHWRIGQYYCVESTVRSRSRATGGYLLCPSPSNAKGVVGLTRAPNTGMGAKNRTVYQGRGRLESGTKHGDGG